MLSGWTCAEDAQVPFGVALVLGAPVMLVRGRLASGLTVVANVGDLVVLLFWLASYAMLSFRDELDRLLAAHGPALPVSAVCVCVSVCLCLRVSVCVCVCLCVSVCLWRVYIYTRTCTHT